MIHFLTLQIFQTKFSVTKNMHDDGSAEGLLEAVPFRDENWIEMGSGHTSSGRGRGGRRGRGRTRGGRSQRSVMRSRSEPGRRSRAANSARPGQLVGWKGRTRGRGGRRRGRRSVRSRQKPVKQVVEDRSEEIKSKPPPRNLEREWNAAEETPTREPVEEAENESSSESSEGYEDDIGRRSGDEGNDLGVDDYMGAFNGRSEDVIEEESDETGEGEEDEEEEEEEEEDDVDVGGYIIGDSDEEERNGYEDGGENGGGGGEGYASSDYSE